MKRDIRSIEFNLIKLDQENVRFGGDIAQNQREAIELMLADPEDTKKILKLSEHIAQYGLDPTELQLVMPENDDSFVVLEGNRRLTALKLLQRPDLCIHEKFLKDFYAAHQQIKGRFPREIDCSVVPTREDGDIWIELKHTGQNGGIGRVSWDSDIRDERRARQTGIESIGRQIREIVRDNPAIFDEIVVGDIYQIPVTTLTRLFSSKRAQDSLGVFVREHQLHFKFSLAASAPSIKFAVRMFRHEGYNVNDVRNDSDRKRFLSHIPPELNPEYVYSNPSNNSQNNTGFSNQAGGRTGSSEGGQGKDNDDGQNDSKDVDSAGRQGDGASGSNNQGQGKKDPKTKARASSKSRKYLIPCSLNITNNRINEIYRDLRSGLEVDRVPNATAVTFRVFLEVSCDDYQKRMAKSSQPVLRDDNKKPLSDDDKLSTKIVAVTRSLELANVLTKSESKAICRRAAGTHTVGSVDHLNQFVHSAASAPLPSELKDVAEEYLPLLKAIWP